VFDTHLETVDEFGRPGRMASDAIVLVTHRLSDERLYLELATDPDALAREGITGVFRAGDCVAPRDLADVVFDGHRLGREIDSENPMVAKPHRRERFIPVLTDATSDSTLDTYTALG
jgi:hypothetical protein